MRFEILSTLGLCTGLLAAVGCAGQGSADTEGGYGGGVLTGAGGAGGATSDTGTTSTSDDVSSSTGPVCVGGTEQACTCKDDLGATTESTQTCFQDGSQWGQCDCPCGDNLCEDNAKENCHTCSADCGACAPCEYKKCEGNAGAPPVSTLTAFNKLDQTLVAMPVAEILENLRRDVDNGTIAMRTIASALAPAHPGETPFATKLREVFAAHPEGERMVRRQLARAGLQNPTSFAARFPEVLPPLHTMADLPNGGTTECGSPLLRVRIGQIHINNPDEDGGDEIYCLVKAEAESGAEVLMTPVYTNLKEGETRDLPVTESTFWGQAAPKSPDGNLRITYQCIEQDNDDTYKNLLDAVGSMAGGVATIPGMPYGWAFGVASVVLPAIGATTALDKDDDLFHAAQDLEPADQLELTNGHFWTVRKDGKNGGFGYKWDWELRIHSWGCAEYGMKE